MAPKCYAILYPNNEEIVKIKGNNQKGVKFKEMKDKFYNRDSIKIKNFTFIEKKNLILQEKRIEKVFDLNKYDKRKFSEDLKETSPIHINDIYKI